MAENYGNVPYDFRMSLYLHFSFLPYPLLIKEIFRLFIELNKMTNKKRNWKKKYIYKEKLYKLLTNIE